MLTRKTILSVALCVYALVVGVRYEQLAGLDAMRGSTVAVVYSGTQPAKAGAVAAAALPRCARGRACRPLSLADALLLFGNRVPQGIRELVFVGDIAPKAMPALVPLVQEFVRAGGRAYTVGISPRNVPAVSRTSRERSTGRANFVAARAGRRMPTMELAMPGVRTRKP